jgi:glycosyltransferase involved in cell wall biosynthesis
MVLIEPPLPFGNAAARWFYVLLRGLAQRGHRVTAFTACSKPGEIAEAKKLFPAPENDLRCYPLPKRAGLRAKLETLWRPYSYMFSRQLQQELEYELALGFDILHLEQLWSAWLGLPHLGRALVNVHHLVGLDLELVRPTMWKGRLDQALMIATERRLLRLLRYVRSCSPRLVPEIQRMNPHAQTTTVPVGFPVEHYPYIADEQRTDAPVVSLIGSMEWYPNYSAAERLLVRLWPQIKQRVPSATLQIVGWNACKALHRFAGMPELTLEENVPDIQPYLARTGVLLYAPGRGSGMKIKVLEALAYGIPVVTTSEGVEGLPAQDSIHAGISDEDAGLVERTIRLLQDPAACNRQRAQGRLLLESHCGPKPTVDAIEAIYESMIHSDRKSDLSVYRKR